MGFAVLGTLAVRDEKNGIEPGDVAASCRRRVGCDGLRIPFPCPVLRAATFFMNTAC